MSANHRTHRPLADPVTNADAKARALAAARALRAAARARHHRHLLLIEGDPAWTYECAVAIAEDLQPSGGPDGLCWIGRGPMGRSLAAASATRVLGREHDLLVYDLFAGLDLNALAAAAGSLCGGGLLLLLGPHLREWPAFVDPAAKQIATFPYTGTDVGHRFIARAARCLAGAAGVTRIAQGATIAAPLELARAAANARPPITPAHVIDSSEAGVRPTSDQERAIEAIHQLAEASRPHPLVISADRGRGKSAALGIAARRLLLQRPRVILITAPRFKAVDTLFRHALSALPSGGRGVEESAFQPRFLAPDVLLRDRPVADLLLIDEAAGIPSPLLQSVLASYPRIVFSTTVHGYEGTGRGFALRFFPILSRHTPGWRHLELTEPIRWAQADPLERLINRMLLLDAEPAADHLIAANSAQPLSIDRCDRTLLSHREALLAQVFGLLMLAHYQTRPADLRHLLDGPNLRVYTLSRGTVLLATALVAEEGDFTQPLARAVFDGERRPRGHLLPQTLCAHAGLPSAATLKFARIVRIAVHPSARRQGLGRALLDAIVEDQNKAAVDLLGASFGATSELLEFWNACGCRTVHLGSRRNAATGAHAAVVLRPLSAAGMALLTEARKRFPLRLIHLLPGRLSALQPELAFALLRSALSGDPSPDIPETLGEQLHSFAERQHSLEAALAALAQLPPERLAQAVTSGTLARSDAECFIALVWQQRTPEEVAPRLGHSGRAALVRSLRRVVGRLISAPVPR